MLYLCIFFINSQTVLARVQRDVRSSIQPQGFRFQQGTKLGNPKKYDFYIIKTDFTLKK